MCVCACVRACVCACVCVLTELLVTFILIFQCPKLMFPLVATKADVCHTLATVSSISIVSERLNLIFEVNENQYKTGVCFSQ